MRNFALLCTLLFAPASLAQEGAPNLRYYYPVPAADPPKTINADVCVYGGTPGGVMMAIQAKRMGKSAVLVVFRKHVGGMTSGGLSAVDLGRGDSIAGIAREFLDRVGKQRGFLPSKAEATFRAMLKDAGVPVYFEQRLKDVKKDGNRIAAITMENGNTFTAKIFGDATYEGDLFAKAGVSFHVGREANAVYKETLNGVQFRDQHNFVKPVDPYKIPGDPKSGLLWGISAADPGKQGDGDKKVQTYNFRMFLTNAPDRLPFPKPKSYDRDKYMLLLRYIKLNVPTQLQLHAGDSNNQGGFSTDHIGANYAWPEGDYATREKIYQDHVNYQQGLMWFWANDPDVPPDLQAKVKAWGLTKGEFPDTGGWPHELYVREGRRMISAYVMTEHNCRSTIVAEDSVGLASYNMDSHNCQRVVINGRVRNEGDVQVGCPRPYPVSYRSIVPKEKECANLFVPVCLSSTHIAYGSIRMEPVFMILGQASGTAASMAIDQNISVQKVPYAQLKEKLLADKQMLIWNGPAFNPKAKFSIDPKTVSGIVVDNPEAKLVGDWRSSASVGPYVGAEYLHDNNEQQGKNSVTFTPKLPKAGKYDVYLMWSANPNRASNVPVEIVHAGGKANVTLNQKKSAGWNKIFTGNFAAGNASSVTIRTDGANGFVIADAVRFVPVDGTKGAFLPSSPPRETECSSPAAGGRGSCRAGMRQEQWELAAWQEPRPPGISTILYEGEQKARKTTVSIDKDMFRINGKPTYAGRKWQGKKIEGLLFNSRMVQGIFDDLNPKTVTRWAYPDTKKWDADRNTQEFIKAMPEWRAHGLLAVTLNLQGGSPEGYSKNQPWHNSAFNADGSLRPDYLKRLEKILDKADEIGMIVILGYFYFGQDERLKDETAVIRGVDEATDWLLKHGYRNVLVEVNNECNVARYDHAILKPARAHELIERVKKRTLDGRRLLVSTSYGGGAVPRENVVRASDFLLIHGNGQDKPAKITEQIRKTRKVAGDRPMPIVNNEDDHYDFDKGSNNLVASIDEYVSWGFFDFRRKGEGMREGYQSPPVDWGITSERKRAFFQKVREITGVGAQ